MWLFSQEGFVSAVKHKYMPGHLMVRARYEKDIRELAKRLGQHGHEPNCKETPDGDYRWRLTCTKTAYKAAMCDMVDDIGYTNFKDQVHKEGDKDRDHAYMGVWSNMNGFQYDKLYPERKKTIGFGSQRHFGFQSDDWSDKELINWYEGQKAPADSGRVTYIRENGQEIIWDYDQDGPPEDWEDPASGVAFDRTKWVVVADDSPIVRGVLSADEVNQELGRGRYHTPEVEQHDSWTELLYNKRGPTRGVNAGGLLPIERQADPTEESGRLHELPPDDFSL